MGHMHTQVSCLFKCGIFYEVAFECLALWLETFKAGIGKERNGHKDEIN